MTTPATTDASLQAKKIAALRALHREPRPFFLPTSWDALSAMLFVQAGFPAVGTGSEGVAAATYGYPDGEKITAEQAREAIRRIVAAVEAPVSADVESGYAGTPEEVYGSMQSFIRCGIAGCNLEDAEHEGADDLRSIPAQTARIRAARKAADDLGLPIVINGVIDTYLTKWDAARKLSETLDRARAYHEAGADCVYAPGLKEPGDIDALVRASGAAVNVLAQPGMTYQRLADQGVRRISFGSGLMRIAMEDTFALSRQIASGDLGAYGERFVPWAQLVQRLVAGGRPIPVP